MDNPDSHFDKNILNLTNSVFLNTYKRVNWNRVIDELPIGGVEITTDPKKWKMDNPEYSKIYDMWTNANFNVNAIKWINYYPEHHFPKLIVDDIAMYLRVNVHRAWISRIDPGYFAPWHWDVDDNEEEYLTKGTPTRYSIILCPPTHGHIFIINDDYIYNVPQGSIFKWNNYRDWHSGINAGMTPKYMFHLLAY